MRKGSCPEDVANGVPDVGNGKLLLCQSKFPLGRHAPIALGRLFVICNVMSVEVSKPR